MALHSTLNVNDQIRTSKITSKHEIKDKEAVFVILEGITQVDDERVVDLYKEASRGEGCVVLLQ